MYNGIGLATPRGSGTSGYVIRNLSTLRSHDKNDRPSTWDAAFPKHREPDQAILEHERKRKVEIKCLELQLELEDKGVDEPDIEKKVDELRQKLLANLASTPGPQSLKPTDTHGMAAAKKIEVARMARALGTRPDYQEGEAFDREKQELNKLKRISEREERERKRAEDRVRMAEQKAKWESERRERDRSRPLPLPHPRSRSPRTRTRTRTRSRSPIRRVSRRSLSPVPRAAPARRRRHPDSRSPSIRSVSRSRSRSPPRRPRHRSNTPPHSRRERSPYLPTPAREGSMRQRGSYRDRSPQLPPRGGSDERDRSPIPVRGRVRSRSVETGSSMSVSTRSGSIGSRHEVRGKARD